MAQKFLFNPGSGSQKYREGKALVIKLFVKGCANRSFFHLGVIEKDADYHHDPIIEQLGSFDPVPNKYNEKLVALNYERIEFWLKKGADLTPPAMDLLGLSGYLPVCSKSMQKAWRYRSIFNEEMKKQREKAAEAEKKSAESAS